jgi:hypothetical protein
MQCWSVRRVEVQPHPSASNSLIPAANVHDSHCCVANLSVNVTDVCVCVMCVPISLPFLSPNTNTLLVTALSHRVWLGCWHGNTTRDGPLLLLPQPAQALGDNPSQMTWWCFSGAWVDLGLLFCARNPLETV